MGKLDEIISAAEKENEKVRQALENPRFMQDFDLHAFLAGALAKEAKKDPEAYQEKSRREIYAFLNKYSSPTLGEWNLYEAQVKVAEALVSEDTGEDDD